ncbi:MAG: prolyl oligopeptidase family serine peptidase [Oscillospiraceae bacterium]
MTDKSNCAKHYQIDWENYYPDVADGMHVVFGERADSFRCTLVPNIVYACQNRPLHLQLLKPVTPIPEKRYPLIVYVQGSGFRAQEIFKPVLQMARFVQSGYLVACVEYRHTDEGCLFPTQICDVKTAIRFLRQHAGEYQIDVDRIGIWGDSSGGHTAAMVGVTSGIEEFDNPNDDKSYSCDVKCVVDFYGIADMVKQAKLKITPEQLEYFKGDPIQKLFGGKIDENMGLIKKACVMPYITSGKKLPPFLLIHGDEDDKVPFWQSIILYNALKECNASAEFYKVKGGGHGHRTWTPEVMAIVEKFLQAYL